MQCPECGCFLATAFVTKVRTEPSPCPRCGTELSLAEGDARPTSTAVAPVVDESLSPIGDTLVPDPDPDVTPAFADAEDVVPEPEESVRPPDLTPDRDPLEGWDEGGSAVILDDEPDPVVIAAGAGVGLLLGMLLGGRDHRGLGGLLGALLGAVVAKLRG